MLHLKCTKMLPLFLLLLFFYITIKGVSVICYAGRLVELDTKCHAMIRTNGSSVSPWGKAALAVCSCAQTANDTKVK